MFHNHDRAGPFQLVAGAKAAEHADAGGAGRNGGAEAHGHIAHHQAVRDWEIELLHDKVYRFRIRLESARSGAAENEFKDAPQPVLRNEGLRLDFNARCDHRRQ